MTNNTDGVKGVVVGNIYAGLTCDIVKQLPIPQGVSTPHTTYEVLIHFNENVRIPMELDAPLNLLGIEGDVQQTYPIEELTKQQVEQHILQAFSFNPFLHSYVIEKETGDPQKVYVGTFLLNNGIQYIVNYMAASRLLTISSQSEGLISSLSIEQEKYDEWVKLRHEWGIITFFPHKALSIGLLKR